MFCCLFCISLCSVQDSWLVVPYRGTTTIVKLLGHCHWLPLSFFYYLLNQNGFDINLIFSTKIAAQMLRPIGQF